LRPSVAGLLGIAGALALTLAAPVAAADEEAEKPAADVVSSAPRIVVLASASISDADEGAESPAPRAADAAPTSGGNVTSSAIPSRPVIYRPPLRGAPRGKVGAGVRGALWLPLPHVLAPDHVALTAQEAPSLFWYVAGAIPDGVRVVFSLVDPARPDPLAEKELPRPTQPGIQRIRLDDLGVTLRPEVECEWSVALVSDADEHDLDLVSVGSILRVKEPRLDDAPADAARLAELGLWYDALEAVHDAVESHPKNAFALQQQAALLRQGGLASAAPEH
jgi:hypothetical protein